MIESRKKLEDFLVELNKFGRKIPLEKMFPGLLGKKSSRETIVFT